MHPLPDVPRAVRTIAAAGALLLASACGGPEADFHVRGVGVFVQTRAPFAVQPDLPARVESVLGVALEYWGGGWPQLAGRSIVLAEGPWVECGSTLAIGCFDGDLRIAASDPGTGVDACVEQTVLVHEVGHAVIGDPGHSDPRWMGFDAVRDALSGRTGYGPDGAIGECLVAASVWRHPPDGP